MTNRRSVLIGLGAIVAGGGAALGSGAFSTAEANRSLDVNVVTDSDIAADFVDILLQAGSHDSVGWEDDVGTEHADGTGEFPTSDASDDYDSYTQDGTEISLMQNDVKVVIGTEGNHLPPNSTVSYDNLFTVVNDDGDDPQAFDVTFEVTGGPTIEFDGDSNVQSSEYTAELATNGDTEEIDVEVDTGEGNESGTLEITITESN